MQTKKLWRGVVLVALVSSLSGCLLTKLVTMPMRVVGSLASVAGAVVSVVPGVGDSVDEALEGVDTGIDAAGVVEQSAVEEFSVGDEVIVTGYDLGMNTSGGFSQYIRVPSSWLIRRPKGLSLREAMLLGTAGLTAGLCVEKLEQSGLSSV